MIEKNANPNQPPFTVESYKNYLAERPHGGNRQRVTDPNKSIFDSMRELTDDDVRKVTGGRTLKQIFGRLR
ncbi:MAG: hypothetical protein LBC59_09485 [Chitinispirillales bacterium]|jgi:hypothetical protein|nr:hypothetical protein [Chitinispirillales bacterium]